MKVAVVAASGRSGVAFVDRALEAGMVVRAGIRSSNPFNSHKNLQVVKCDAGNKSDLENLMKGCDAVVSLIGHVKGSPANIQTDATKNIVAAMKKLNIKRLISLTGTGVRQRGDKITLLDRFLNFGVSVADPARVKDGIEHFKVIENSSLDWTVLRVLKLQNTKPKKYRLTLNGPAKTIVSREEIADAIIDVLRNKKFHKKAPIISG